MATIDLWSDTLDTYELRDRLAELEVQDWSVFDGDDADDYMMLTRLEQELHVSLADLANEGAVLIRDSAFRDYIRDECEEIYALDTIEIPAVIRDNIDWDGVADDCRSDYSEVDIVDWDVNARTHEPTRVGHQFTWNGHVHSFLVRL